MRKKTIQIDENKCVGCGICAKTCKQSAIEMVDGKAKVTRDDVCDGIGNCLPVCPVHAIHFTEFEAAATVGGQPLRGVLEGMRNNQAPMSGCPGKNAKMLKPLQSTQAMSGNSVGENVSALRQWPVQIKLVPENAPYFHDAHLLIAADCSAYAYANFHKEFMRNKITLIGCPKLDAGDYTEKLTAIITNNQIKSVTVVRMEVPCCGGIENATVQALQASGKFLPWRIVTLSTEGVVLED